MLPYYGFSSISYIISSYVVNKLADATSMHGCGAESADNHFGKVWLTCATNMAKIKFEAAP